jgi:nicotinamide phosphoribosyltransferase
MLFYEKLHYFFIIFHKKIRSYLIPALQLLIDYYNYLPTNPISVRASEHSIMCQRGRLGEHDIARNIVLSHPDKITSIVIDAYNDEKFLDFIGTELKEDIKKRTAPLIIRPDSKTPIEAIMMCFNKLEYYFGSTFNSKGYKVLPPYIRIIQGDGINIDSIDEILIQLVDNKISIDNVIFGMGGALLQKIDRDTQKFAIKCSQVTLKDGTTRNVFKDPIGDKGKKSKSGKLALIYDDGYHTMRIQEIRGKENLLKLVYKNGKLMNEQSFPFKVTSN